MTQPRARTLRFAVTGSLLAVPALAGCQPERTNVSPQDPVTVDEAAQPSETKPPADDVTPDPTTEDDPGDPTDTTTNTGPMRPPEPKPPVVITNPGPQQPPTPAPKP
jgi:hypothetical protein